MNLSDFLLTNLMCNIMPLLNRPILDSFILPWFRDRINSRRSASIFDPGYKRRLDALRAIVEKIFAW